VLILFDSLSGKAGPLAVTQRHETGHYLLANLPVTGYLENEFHNQVPRLLWHEPNIGPQKFPMEKFLDTCLSLWLKI
jgi:hypothetical protein